MEGILNGLFNHFCSDTCITDKAFQRGLKKRVPHQLIWYSKHNLWTEST